MKDQWHDAASTISHWTQTFWFQRILTLAPLLETAIIQLALAELLAGCAAKIISVAGKQC